MEKFTKIDAPTARKSPPSITRGFNQGIGHMYENPVEREARDDARIMKASIDDRMSAIHRLIFGK